MLGGQQPPWSRARRRLGPLGAALLGLLARPEPSRPSRVVRIAGSSSPRRSPCTAVSAAPVSTACLLIVRAICSSLIVRSRLAVGGNLGAVHRDHPDRRQAGVRAQRQHLAKQLAQRGLVKLDVPRDRGVIR
jgi:hypothetical protein